MGAMMGGGMMPNSDAPTSNGFGPGAAGPGQKMAPQKSHFRRGKILTPALSGLDIGCAGKWSLLRPFNYNMPYSKYDLSEII